VELGHGAASADTSWHQVNAHVLNGNGSTPFFRMDRADDTATQESLSGCDQPINKVGYNARSGSEDFPGKIAAILYYQTNSGTLVDRTAVETYLHNKYGL